MRRKAAFMVLVAGAAVLGTMARGGHELPVYPSYYPHEIEIRTLSPDRADNELRKGEIQAYVSEGLGLAGAPAEQIRAIETLGSLIVAHINPASSLWNSGMSACDIVNVVVGKTSPENDFVLHPYPVTPFHGDYLYHSDLVAAAKARFSQTNPDVRPPKIKASGRFAQHHADWVTPDADWDVEISEVDAAKAMAAEMLSVNGRLGPPWVRTGWFNAERLLGGYLSDPPLKAAAETTVRRLQTGDFNGLAERINLERGLVTLLTGGCRALMIGYTVKREYVNVEFSAGIENIGYDAITGLASPMFIRTVKLKDFPWNGWLTLGIADRAGSAWNPVGGMTDAFGRLMGFAVTDPALLPSPYETGWMLNRIADLPSDRKK
jgi:hypothetical protein